MERWLFKRAARKIQDRTGESRAARSEAGASSSPATIPLPQPLANMTTDQKEDKSAAQDVVAELTPKNKAIVAPSLLEQELLRWWGLGKSGASRVWPLVASQRPTPLQWQRLAFLVARLDNPEALEVVAAHCDVLALRSDCVIDKIMDAGTLSWIDLPEEALRLAENCAARKSSLLSFAASSGAVSAVEWLLERGANPADRDALGRTPLMHAAIAGQTACVNALLPVSEANAIDDNGLSALSLCLEAQWDAAECALAIARAGVHCPDFAKTLESRDVHGLTPLMQAAVKGHEEKFSEGLIAVLASKSDWAAKSKDGHTAFDMAAAWPKCADILSESIPLAQLACSRAWIEAVETREPQKLPRIMARMEAQSLRATITETQANASIPADRKKGAAARI